MLQTGHSKEWFSKQGLSQKSSLFTKQPFIPMNDGFPKPVIIKTG
jgi:hypothetical protein